MLLIQEREEQELQRLVTARFAQSMEVPATFFEPQAGRIAEACWAMARRFHQGGRLFAFGNGAWATDAQHVAVEFVHPVIVGKRALPALALPNDSATLSRLIAGDATSQTFARQLRALARPQDIALGFAPDSQGANVLTALREARSMGLLALAFVGGEQDEQAQEASDFCFAVPSSDPLTIQETHETLYHILWELVHVFFEHEGLLQ